MDLLCANPTCRPRDLKGVGRHIHGEVHRVSQGLLILCVRLRDIAYFVILVVFHIGLQLQEFEQPTGVFLRCRYPTLEVQSPRQSARMQRSAAEIYI